MDNGDLKSRLLDVLSATREDRFVLQDFRPLPESLEWKLGQLCWDAAGVRVFVRGHVPFAVNNDGDLSANAADLLFGSLQCAEQRGSLEGEIWVLELGVGTGLFARFFLDRLREICEAQGKDYYRRCHYVAADQSPRMLADVEKHGILADHPGRYVLWHVDAVHPEGGLARLEAAVRSSPLRFHAIVLNYLLDALPAAVLRVGPEEVTQLYVRTCLARGVDLQDFTPLSRAELVRRAESPDPLEQRALIDLYRVFSLDYEFRPVDIASLPYGSLALQCMGGDQSNCLHNYAAIQCLHGLLPRVREEGFVLVNDYGYTESDDMRAMHEHQRFYGTTAIGLNFPLLKSACDGIDGWRWIEPSGDNGHICSRLIARGTAPAAMERFQKQFGKEAFDWRHEPRELAKACIQQGRHEAALSAYLEAVERQPYNCFLLEEIAGFLAYTVRDHKAALAIAKAALALNPISPSLWNIYGDCLFYLKRVDEAHRAFERALEVDPQSVLACYNLVYTYSHYHDYSSALRMVAQGLGHDTSGEYRDRLLQRQAELLRHLSQRQQIEAACSANRSHLVAYRDMAEQLTARAGRSS